VGSRVYGVSERSPELVRDLDGDTALRKLGYDGKVERHQRRLEVDEAGGHLSIARGLAPRPAVLDPPRSRDGGDFGIESSGVCLWRAEPFYEGFEPCDFDADAVSNVEFLDGVKLVEVV